MCVSTVFFILSCSLQQYHDKNDNHNILLTITVTFSDCYIFASNNIKCSSSVWSKAQKSRPWQWQQRDFAFCFLVSCPVLLLKDGRTVCTTRWIGWEKKRYNKRGTVAPIRTQRQTRCNKKTKDKQVQMFKHAQQLRGFNDEEIRKCSRGRQTIKHSAQTGANTNAHTQGTAHRRTTGWQDKLCLKGGFKEIKDPVPQKEKR